MTAKSILRLQNVHTAVKLDSSYCLTLDFILIIVEDPFKIVCFQTTYQKGKILSVEYFESNHCVIATRQEWPIFHT